MGKTKYYVVWAGKTPGIYSSWKDCKEQVEGVAAARFKSFDSLREAEGAFQNGFSPALKHTESWPARKRQLQELAVQPVWNSISVDAACKGNPGLLEYRGVNTANGKELFHQGPFHEGTNNLGEFLAIVHALSALKKQGSDLPVYSDSLTARKWVKDKAVKTKLLRTKNNDILFDLVDRALKWLRENDYHNKILTWNTELWGEIPADFGRK